MKILRFDSFSQESAKPKWSSYSFNPEKLKLIEKEFLSTFRSVSDTDWFAKGSNWGDFYAARLKADPYNVFCAYLESGLIIEAPPAMVLEYDLKLIELQKELKKRELKTSGKKIELAERLLQVEPNYKQFLKKKSKRYTLTEKGREIVSAYFDQQDRRKNNAVQKFKKEFHGGNLLEAEKAALSYRNDKALGGGMFGDNLLPVDRIKYLFGDIPPMIRDVEPVYLNLAREISAEDEVFGSEQIFPHELLDTKTRIGLTLRQVSVVFLKAMWCRSSIQKANSDGISEYFCISGQEESCCKECRNLIGFYPLNKPIPILPNEKCLNHGLCNIDGTGTTKSFEDCYKKR